MISAPNGQVQWRGVTRDATPSEKRFEKGARKGDTVRIVESRPLSKRKRWVVEEIVTKALITDEDNVETA